MPYWPSLVQTSPSRRKQREIYFWEKKTHQEWKNDSLFSSTKSPPFIENNTWNKSCLFLHFKFALRSTLLVGCADSSDNMTLIMANWLLVGKNMRIPFQSINPVIDPGSPSRLRWTWSRLLDTIWHQQQGRSSFLNPLELSWHRLTLLSSWRRWDFSGCVSSSFPPS